MCEARVHAADILRAYPKYSLKVLASPWLCKEKEALQPTLELLLKAGIPEG